MAQAPRTQKAPVRASSKSATQTVSPPPQNATQTAAPPPPPPPERASGVDVSQYQQTVDWKRAASAGQSFAFVKAARGEKDADPMFMANWTGAKEAGLLRGAYHVFDPNADPVSQADFFIKTVLSTNDNGELPPVLDIEPVDASAAVELVPRAKAWLDRVESALGKKPIIYSSRRTLQDSFVDVDGLFPSWAAQHPLWIAEYSAPEGQPKLPRGWSNWTFWQYTDQGQVNGIQGKTDLNFFNGSLEGLRRFAVEPAAELEKLRLNFALNDRPQGPDRLDYEKYADAFAQVLSGRYTQTPLTVGVYASWGMGKSFLLGKIREKLQAVKERDEQLDFAFIDFNAWVYSGSENLWAGLVTTLYDGIEQHYESGGDRLVQDYRRRESLKQIWRTFKKSLMLVAVFGIPAFIISLLLDYQSIEESWKVVANAVLLILGGAPLLSKLPNLLKGVKSLIDSVVLLRSQELAKLSSRKDFREQVGFMADIQAELRHISDLIKDLDERKKRKTRFIIFVDDLDRCAPEKAVEVLEAIMLLLSDRTEDPFIIFLAMDARVLVKAIEMRYGGVLKESGISGYEFLDKIVQIPFRIPPAPDGAIKKYVKSLLYQSPEAHEKAETAAQQPPAMDEKDTPETVDESTGDKTQREEMPPRTAPGTGVQREAESSAAAAPPEEEPFKPEEEQAFEKFSKYISRNPRRVKRIVNIYRMARILISSDISLQAAVKWAILTEQWPFRIAWVMQKIEDDIQLGREISTGWTLADVYKDVRAFVHDERSRPLALLDEDAEIFEAFVKTDPLITVGDIHKLWSVTFNLNPAMQNEVLKSALQNGMSARRNGGVVFLPASKITRSTRTDISHRARSRTS